MKQRVFLTGSTSYLGTKFIELYSDVFDVLGVSRSDQHNPTDISSHDAVQRLYKRFQPDIIIHLAADLGRDATTSEEIIKTNPDILKNLIRVAQTNNTPFIFTSTEAVYGGKETAGGYTETDDYRPRSPYGQSKVLCEKLLHESGLPYLITRGHRYVGYSAKFNNKKQFPDTMRQLDAGKTVHLDAKKLFTPVLINNICDIFAHYIAHDSDNQLTMNIGVDYATTYYDFVVDVAKSLGLSNALLLPDGEEAGWPANSTLSMKYLQELQYPYISYQQLIEMVRNDILRFTS